MSDIKKVKISELPELQNPREKDYWFLGYNTEGGKTKSKKVSLDKLTKSIDDTMKSEVANATINFKGYHSSLTELQTAYPQASTKKDFSAWVGPYPCKVYKVFADGGNWIDTGDVVEAEIDLEEYARVEAVYNVSQLHNKYDFIDKQTARNTIPIPSRGLGQSISYKLAIGKWVTEVFLGSVLSEWGDNSKWDREIRAVELDYIESTSLVPENKVVKIIPDRTLSETTGLGEIKAGYSITDLIAIKKGDILTINSNQVVTFYTADTTKVAHFTPSINSTPVQDSRNIVVDGDYSFFRFSLLSGWTSTIYCYINFISGVIEKGIPTKSVIHNNKKLSDIVDRTLFVDRGQSLGAKKSICFTEVQGLVSISGDVVTTGTAMAKGTVATSGVLDKNSFYLIEFGTVVTGRIFASLSGNALSMGGRKSAWFRTDERDNQILTLMVQGNLDIGSEMVTYDVRGKYKVYKIEEPSILTASNYNGKLPSVGADYSSSPSATIPEPKFIIWNVRANYYKLTETSEYSKDSFVVEYLDSNGNYFQKYATIGGQGRTSMTFENHNMKCKLTNRDGSKFVLKIGDWLPRSTYHFKVNYIDFSHSKNQGTANFITDWYRDVNDKTKKEYPWKKGYVFKENEANLALYDNRPRGVIAGIPCSICTYWNHRSMATMNLNAFAENFNLNDKNPLHRGFRGDTDFQNKWRWEEMCSDTEGEAMSEETWKPFYDFSKWLKDNSSSTKIQDFIAGDGIRYDKDDMIDYWLLAEFIYASDNGWANQVWISYDSIKFTPMWYDMDACFGSHAKGEVLYPPNTELRPNSMDIYFWVQLKRAFSNEIQDRYKALRDSGRFSVGKVREIYGSYISRFPYEWYEMDFHMWRDRLSIKEGNFSSLERIIWFTEGRLKFLDNKYGYAKL